MKLNKFILGTLICGLLLMSTNTYAQNTSYTEEEIEEYGRTQLEKLIQEDPWQINMAHSQNIKPEKTQVIAPRSSMYKEFFDCYVPNVVTYKPDAFLVYTTSADNRNGNYTKDGYTVTFNVSTTVTGSHKFSGKGSSDLTIPIINKGVKLELGYEFVTSSSTTASIGTQFPIKNLTERTIYYVDFFHHGIYTSGGAQYKWYDVTGNSGTKVYPLEGGALYPTPHATIHASAAYKR